MDSAYRSKAIEEKVKERGLTSRIHRKGYRNRPLRDWEKAGNKSRSRFRARVEHVFGAQRNDMGGTLVRSIGLVPRQRDMHGCRKPSSSALPREAGVHMAWSFPHFSD